MRTREWIAIGIALAGWNAVIARPSSPSWPSPLPSLIPIEPPAAVPSHTIPAAATSNTLPTLLPESLSTPVAEVPPPTVTIEREPCEPCNPCTPRLPLRPRLHRRRADTVCGSSVIVWFAPSLELVWLPRAAIPNDVRVRLPVWGGSIPGPVLPVAGRSTGQFGAALGLAGGVWFNEANTHGLDASFLFREMTNTFDVFTPGYLTNFPLGPDRSAAQIIPFPDPLAKLILGWLPSSQSTDFVTVDVNYRFNILGTASARLDGLVGYRYAHLSDDLYLGVQPKPLSMSNDPNNPNYVSNISSYNQNDFDDAAYLRNRVSVSNNFHGGQVGLAGEVQLSSWYVSGSAKVAFGTVASRISTTGVFVGAEGQVGNQFQPLGMLVGGNQTDFAIMPAASVQFGRQFGEHARFFVGYSFLSLNHIARLSDALNPSNSDRKLSDFCVHSISLGAEFRF